MNYQAVIEEEKSNKLPANWEARKRRAEWILNDDKERKAAQEKVNRIDSFSFLIHFSLLLESAQCTNIPSHQPVA